MNHKIKECVDHIATVVAQVFLDEGLPLEEAEFRRLDLCGTALSSNNELVENLRIIGRIIVPNLSADLLGIISRAEADLVRIWPHWRHSVEHDGSFADNTAVCLDPQLRIRCSHPSLKVFGDTPGAEIV